VIGLAVLARSQRDELMAIRLRGGSEGAILRFDYCTQEKDFSPGGLSYLGHDRRCRMKHEIELSEEESSLLIELLEENQERLRAEISQARTPDRQKELRRRFQLTQKVVDSLSREPSQSILSDDWPEDLRPSGYC
jgi:hypothetical protein